MKTFRCDHCGHPLFFENVRCLQCGSDLAFLPHRLALCAIEPAPGQPAGRWQRHAARRTGPAHRLWTLCRNHAQQACNFALPADDPGPYCMSCRQTRVLPDLSVAGNLQRWTRIEAAKRRLFYTLAQLGLVRTLPPHGEGDGPVFEFKADLPGQAVLTGHADGVITLNVAEADDPERASRRIALHEPYRTLLGHLRHESGHFYWDRLVRDEDRLEPFRALFGDERLDYGQALQDHYARGGSVAGWQDSFVSAYASAHPWEDWAETWAHYLHMADLLETAASFNTRVEVPGGGGDEVDDPFQARRPDFDAMLAQWVPVTLLVNSLNRSLGQDDAYPFALPTPAIAKLRYVHEVVWSPRRTAVAAANPAPVTKPPVSAGH